MAVHPVTLCTWLYLLLVNPAWAANILMVPIASDSHAVMFGQLAAGLVADGHSVTMLIPTNTRVPDQMTERGVTVYRYQGEKEQFLTSQEESEIIMKFALADSLWEILQIVLLASEDQDPHVHWDADCQGLFADTKLLQLLAGKHYDFAVLDGIYPPCYYTLAYKLDIPYASMSLAYAPAAFRIPHLSSQTPNMFAMTSDRMNFFQRLKSFFVDCLELALTMNLKGNFVEKYAPEKKPKTSAELLQGAKLWFYLHDPVLNFPRARMPNTLFIGDLMARDANPLSPEWETIMASPHGVILVSLGSMLKGMPQKYIQILYDGLGKLPQAVLMKKAGFVPEHIPTNIILRNWIPQNDVLAHQNLKLFVSHCGQNSIVEAIYHGKPILGIPLAFDQPYNGIIVEEKGFGKVLKVGKFDAEQLKTTATDMLNNSTYTDTAKSLSETFRDKPDTAAKRVSFWIRHVLEHGDEHLRTTAFDLNIAQFMMLDIYLFLLLVMIFSMLLFYFILRCSCRICLKICRRKEKLKKS